MGAAARRPAESASERRGGAATTTADDREVGELRAGAGDSEPDVGLVANVQKEQRAHGGEEHGPEAKVARECGLVQGKSSA